MRFRNKGKTEEMGKNVYENPRQPTLHGRESKYFNLSLELKNKNKKQSGPGGV